MDNLQPSNKTLCISQSDLIMGFLEYWGIQECKTSNIPLQHNPNSLPPPSLNACGDIPDNKILSSYQRLVGSLTYLTICMCPNITYTAMALGQFNASPTRSHLACAKGVLCYLDGTVNLCLQFPLNRYQTQLHFPLHVDFLTWTGHLMRRDCKSVSGYCFYYLGSLILWSSWKQRMVSTSSTESEYYVLTNTIKEAIWMTLFLSFTKFPSP